jgi:hypothetical protein
MPGPSGCEDPPYSRREASTRSRERSSRPEPVPERNTKKLAAAAQDGLFPIWRHHALFTNQTTPMVDAEKTHRGHAITSSRCSPT